MNQRARSTRASARSRQRPKRVKSMSNDGAGVNISARLPSAYAIDALGNPRQQIGTAQDSGGAGTRLIIDPTTRRPIRSLDEG